MNCEEFHLFGTSIGGLLDPFKSNFASLENPLFLRVIARVRAYFSSGPAVAGVVDPGPKPIPTTAAITSWTIAEQAAGEY
jgi:hypothetical protein